MDQIDLNSNLDVDNTDFIDEYRLDQARGWVIPLSLFSAGQVAEMRPQVSAPGNRGMLKGPLKNMLVLHLNRLRHCANGHKRRQGTQAHDAEPSSSEAAWKLPKIL